MSDGTTHWNGTTHYAGCIQSGKEHYECALQEIGRLRLTITHLRVKLEPADNRNTRNYYADGYEAGYQAGMEEKKPWVGLTNEDKNNCLVSADPCESLSDPEAQQLMKDVEAKLKEKNT